MAVNHRRCGKPNCVCAQLEHPGHGPRHLWTRSGEGGKTTGRQLAPAELDKVRGEIGRYQQFAELSRQVVEVNEAICEARPASGPPDDAEPGAEAEKGGSPGS